ncbi:MAG TPA: glycoside hydrolase family 97 protein [Bacteroidales bacterium]|nr:glycoside hydrolase family 97 protein [Bacteroidales bacterium]HPS73660.1 glycoside hydrolase family 97 protein [Bacteroidales bacterium]
MKKLALILLVLLGNTTLLQAGEKNKIAVTSPDGQTTAFVEVSKGIRFSLVHKGVVMINPSAIGMSVNGTRPDQVAVIGKIARKEVRETLTPVVPSYNATIPDHYNETTISLGKMFGLIVRVYDDGAAYRFYTRFPGEITVDNEVLELSSGVTDSIWFPEETSFLTHSERLYRYLPVWEATPGHFCSLPALLVKPGGWKVAITEADIFDYAGLYLMGTGDTVLRAVFPRYPLEETQTNDRTINVTKRAEYIARTAGTRNFPWRVFGLAEHDTDLIGKELVYRLGPSLQLRETSWIRPGKVAWDWWNALNISGVDFKSGYNTATYKYYIDFASRYGLEYIILDEGWSDPSDLFKIKPEMDMNELFRYAKEKNVRIIPWVVWCTLDRQLDSALTQFEKWGAAGIKVDFMQRDDQKMVNYYWKIAQKAAEHHLLVDFHGSYKPDGMNRAFPNVLTREGVRGLENCKWSDDITPNHCAILPYIRMYAGAMDFTPGAMINAARYSFKPVYFHPMSMGTRCQQLALYVLYDSPLQMLADSPSHYLKEPEAMEFLSVVPVTWDETKVLGGEIADYLYMAKRKGDTWYIGGMTDFDERSAEIPLEFLGNGKWNLKIYRDGVNADREGTDFILEQYPVDKTTVLKITMASGGGFAGILTPEK